MGRPRGGKSAFLLRVLLCMKREGFKGLVLVSVSLPAMTVSEALDFLRRRDCAP